MAQNWSWGSQIKKIKIKILEKNKKILFNKKVLRSWSALQRLKFYFGIYFIYVYFSYTVYQRCHENFFRTRFNWIKWGHEFISLSHAKRCRILFTQKRIFCCNKQPSRMYFNENFRTSVNIDCPFFVEFEINSNDSRVRQMLHYKKNFLTPLSGGHFSFFRRSDRWYCYYYQRLVYIGKEIWISKFH